MRNSNQKVDAAQAEEVAVTARRDFLKKAGKFAVVTPPAVMLLMKPSYAKVCQSAVGRVKGNNGIGNGLDPQPPGNPKENDTAGIVKGNRPTVESRT